MRNTLYYGDNLDILRRYIDDGTVDLTYLDPPFNSNADYNVLFAEKDGTRAPAQIKAFEDTWTWDLEAAAEYGEVLRSGHDRVAKALKGMHDFLGGSDMMAYLSMMALRLIELRRVLKPTGSIYLHCDPTASHYLKILMDATFGPDHFINEIVWLRSNAHNFRTRYWPRQQDVLLMYSRGDTITLNPVYQPYGPEQLKRYKPDENGRLYTGRDMTVSLIRRHRQFEWRGVKPPPHRSWGASREQLEKWYAEGRILLRQDGKPRFDGLKIYLDEAPGKQIGTVWTDIPRVSNTAAERLGYPTQKPTSLLERIVQASSNEGDVVLDPFCGCGTTIAAAQKLGRRWIGIDITHLAINLIKVRLADTFSAKIAETYDVIGEPKDLPSARALAEADKYQFQYWALGLVNARPMEEKKGADKGIDGRLYLTDREGQTATVIISVKGGHVTASQVRDLIGTMQNEGAAIGVFITLEAPTKPMREAAASAGMWTTRSLAGTSHPRVQILTIEELLAGKKIDLPAQQDIRAFKQAPKAKGKTMREKGLF